MNHRYVIGVDPGVTVGLAVWDRLERKFQAITSTDFWGVFDWAEKYPPDTCRFVVETADSAPVFWQRKAGAANANTLAKIARNVGQVTREAQLLVRGLRRLGYDVSEIKPMGKQKDQEFRRLTKWNQRTNQHERDAAVMVFGV